MCFFSLATVDQGCTQESLAIDLSWFFFCRVSQHYGHVLAFDKTYTVSIWKRSIHVEYLENSFCEHDKTRWLIRRDPTAYNWIYQMLFLSWPCHWRIGIDNNLNTFLTSHTDFFSSESTLSKFVCFLIVPILLISYSISCFCVQIVWQFLKQNDRSQNKDYQW